MNLGLASRRALVMASSQGLGLGIARMLAEEGCDVLLTSRNPEKLAAAAMEINRHGRGQAHWAAADLAEPNVAGKLFQQANELLGGVDILVNNTSGPSPTPPSQISTPTWQSEFEKMVLPVLELTRLAVAPMRERGWGRIITITSSGVVQPIPNLGISNALRSSLTAWLKTLASEVAREGVTVNVVAPGRIETDRTRQIDAAAAQRLGRSQEDVVQDSLLAIPMRRYGRVDEFASVVTFLASQMSSYVTGSVIRVDGGMIKSI